MMVICLTVVIVLMSAGKVDGRRFCGKPLADFLTTTCANDGKVNLKSRKYRLIVIRMIQYLPMSTSEKKHLGKYLFSLTKYHLQQYADIDVVQVFAFSISIL